ncbi:MAG: ExeA family protein [Gammaproteobacteria bacterium]
MYESFYGLSEKPFAIVPDPEFLYWAATHSNAYTMLEYGILNNAGFTVITGEIGCGKTTLIRKLLETLEATATIGLINNTMPHPGHLLEWVMMSLGQPFEQTSYVGLYQQFQQFLIDEYMQGRHVVLIVDEAQNLGIETLEELRMLSNINSDKDQLIQMILVGQPQLRDLLRRPELHQFQQRIISDFHLKPLSDKEVVEYIYHRLYIAGAHERLFSQNACLMIAHASAGVPRTINLLCDRALIYGYSAGTRQISTQVVDKMLRDAEAQGLGHLTRQRRIAGS